MSPNADDPASTTARQPGPAPGPDATADFASGAPPAWGTATLVQASPPGQPGSVSACGSEPVTIPGYQIEGVLGRGGMGVVYRARHLSLKRTVALKMVLSGAHAGSAELARFRTEAEAVARLQHPNIVQIHEVGEAAGHPYLALEFVAGGTLASKLGGNAMPPREAARLVEALARAMQLAHSRNVVHRDLKPANVLLAPPTESLHAAGQTSWGTPKITDFGLARRTDTDSSQTQSGAIMGTPSYMAPEQAEGRTHEAGPAADVYALGAILYECLTGRPPFKGETMVETLDLVRNQEPVPPSRGRPGVPLDLETICLKCLRKEPENRYASAAELADELVRYLRGEPILARPVGRIEHAIKWVKRNQTITGATAAVLLALAVGTTVSYRKYLDAEHQKGIAEERRIDAENQREEARREADKAKKARDFLVSIFRLSEADIRGGNVTARQILADAERRIPVEFAHQPELQADLAAAIDEVNRNLDRNTPAAMILEARGPIRIRSARGEDRPAGAQNLLFPEDRMILGPDAHLRLYLLANLHQEWLGPGCEATLHRAGCVPTNVVSARSQGVPLTFARLEKGTFFAGGGGGKPGKKVETIRDPFEIASHLVTQGQWEAVMLNNPSHFSRFGPGRDLVKDISDEELKLFPVEQVSWDDVQEFLEKLNKTEAGNGYRYRLPSEAEWEYACRGGATSREDCSYHFYFTQPTNVLSSDLANFDGNLPFGNAPRGPHLKRTTRVGSYPANKLGLCDMHGNVWQWCQDEVGAERVLRGGGWSRGGSYLLASSRRTYSPTVRLYNHGFRLARVPVESAPR